jgi:PEP-CTERM motif
VKLNACLTAAVVLAFATSDAHAVQLVVMAVNSNIGISGAKEFTIGVQVTASDVAANPDSTLFVKNISFAGAFNGPIQAPGANNVQDIQTAWATVDALSPNSITNGGSGGPSFPTFGPGVTELYKDSWWYSSSTGTLQGINGFAPDQSADNIGTVTTVNSGQGVYAQGPGALVGTTGYVFQPEASGITGGGAAVGGVSAMMGYTGIFGPLGANVFDQSPISSEFVGGVLAIPLAQIISKGNVAVPDVYSGGAGQFIALGGTAYNFRGGPATADPGTLTLNFATGSFAFAPEPSTLILAAFGALALLAYHRRK